MAESDALRDALLAGDEKQIERARKAALGRKERIAAFRPTKRIGKHGVTLSGLDRGDQKGFEREKGFDREVADINNSLQGKFTQTAVTQGQPRTKRNPKMAQNFNTRDINDRGAGVETAGARDLRVRQQTAATQMLETEARQSRLAGDRALGLTTGTKADTFRDEERQLGIDTGRQDIETARETGLEPGRAREFVSGEREATQKFAAGENELARESAETISENARNSFRPAVGGQALGALLKEAGIDPTTADGLVTAFANRFGGTARKADLRGDDGLEGFNLDDPDATTIEDFNQLDETQQEELFTSMSSEKQEEILAALGG